MASELIVQTLKGPTSGANANKVIVPSGHTLDASAGSFMPAPDQILQVKHVQWDTTTIHSTATTYIEITDSAITITAKGNNSKFYLTSACNVYQNSSGNGANLGFFRDTTLIRGTNGTSGDGWLGFGNSSIGTLSGTISKQHMDNPNVSAGTSLTYKVALGKWTGGTLYLNYETYNGTTADFTVMEIAQ